MTNIPTKSKEQKTAEAEVDGFRQGLGPFVVAAETTRMAMVFTDAKEADNPIIFANDSYLALTGYGREEVLGQGFNFLVAHVADPDALKLIEAEFAGTSDTGSEVLYRRKDGSEFWAAIFISPVKDEAGDIVQYFASFVDLTRQKEAQAQSASLIDELNHRVKNTLSTVQSIVSQALRMGSDPKVVRQTVESRLFALSRSHDLLTRDNWKGAGISDVVHEAMEPFATADGRDDRIVISGENFRVSPKATLALGIAFHELATNAVKYGAFLNEKGFIVIGWALETAPAGNQLVIRWEEKDGPAVLPPSRTGFGTRVLDGGLAQELQGTVQLEYPPGGVQCTISIPTTIGASYG